jgi:hypothetical protein
MENIRQRYVGHLAQKSSVPSKIKGILIKQLIGAIIVASILIAAWYLNTDFGAWIRRKIAENLAYNFNYEDYWRAVCSIFTK